MFPRLLLEVSINQSFPGKVSFINEFGDEIDIEIVYEWLPITCKHCSGMGHKDTECRNKPQTKQAWVPKKPVETKEKVLDKDGFQTVAKGKKIVQTIDAGVVEVGNSFNILLTGESEEQMHEVEMDNKRGEGGPLAVNG